MCIDEDGQMRYINIWRILDHRLQTLCLCIGVDVDEGGGTCSYRCRCREGIGIGTSVGTDIYGTSFIN